MERVGDPPGLPQPPEAPKVARRVQLTWPQWVGIPLLMLLPLLALLELFGETRAEAEAAGGGLELRAEYPTRLRMGQRSVLEIRVRNVSAGRLETVRVLLDPDYLRRFSRVTVQPEMETLFAVHLLGMAPGEERTVRVEMEAKRPWNGRGWVSAVEGATERARLTVRTFVFP